MRDEKGERKDVSLSKGEEERVRAAFEMMMKKLHAESSGASLRIDILADGAVQDFIKTHQGVLDGGIENVGLSEGMRQRLSRSNYIFSGLKTFHELNEAFPSLLDESGNRKPFERFLNDVQQIDERYNRHYLRAEYNFAHSSAQMAAKWEEFDKHGDRYLLQYRTANDGKVRPAHAALHNVTLEKSDPFWEEFLPPNGWNCRCTVVEVRRSKYVQTPHDEAMELGEEATRDDRRRMFRWNSGKTGKTFPDYNPYTIKQCRDCDFGKLGYVAQNELCAACKLIHECDTKAHINHETFRRILSKPLSEQYAEIGQEEKGRVLRHELVCVSGEDYDRVVDVAHAIAKEIGDCRINPEINKKENRSEVYAGLNSQTSNPDLWAEEYGYIDVKSPQNITNCCRNANKASKQGACVCLTDHYLEYLDDKKIEKRNSEIWRSQYYNHDVIFWLVNGELRKYKRPKKYKRP